MQLEVVPSQAEEWKRISEEPIERIKEKQGAKQERGRRTRRSRGGEKGIKTRKSKESE